MSKPLKFAIITPSYNQGQFLEQTIKSILTQDPLLRSLYIADGGSSDQSVEIIRKYEKDVAWWVSEKDRGQTHAINKAFEKINPGSDFVNWINSDDVLKPGALKELEIIIRERPETLVVAARCEDIDEKGKFLVLRPEFPPPEVKGLYSALRYVGYCQPSTFYRYSVARKLYPLPEDLHFCMDYVLWLRYLFLFGFTRIARHPRTVVTGFRRHEAAKSGPYLRHRFEEDILMIYGNFGSYVRPYREEMGWPAWLLRSLYFQLVFTLNLYGIYRKRERGWKETAKFLRSSLFPFGIGILIISLIRVCKKGWGFKWRQIPSWARERLSRKKSRLQKSMTRFWEEDRLRNITPPGCPGPEGWDVIDFLSRFEPLRSAESVIEIGCGRGRLAGAFPAPKYLGVDINNSAVEEARRLHPSHRFVTIRYDEPYPTAECGFAYTVFLHIPDELIEDTIRKISSSFRKFVVCEILGRHWRERQGKVPVFNRDQAEYVDLFQSHGFRLEKVTLMPYAHYPNTEISFLVFSR